MTGEDSSAVPWRELSEDERRRWADKVADIVVVDRKARLIVVSGECPNCGHLFVFRPSDRAIHAEARGRFRDRVNQVVHATDQATGFDWSGSLRFLVACHCEHSHAGRPGAIRHGCGASGWLEDEPE